MESRKQTTLTNLQISTGNLLESLNSAERRLQRVVDHMEGPRPKNVAMNASKSEQYQTPFGLLDDRLLEGLALIDSILSNISLIESTLAVDADDVDDGYVVERPSRPMRG